MRPINEIIVHCADTPPSWGGNMTPEQQRDEIRRWHVEERGWSDIGYHYVITRNGVVVQGRPLDKIGAHVKGHNKGTIGICLVGGKGGTAHDKFRENFTKEQDFALRKLIDELKDRFVSINKVSGHNKYAAKACPCFNVQEWLTGGMSSQKSITQSTTMKASAAQVVAGVGTAGTAIGALDGDAQKIVLVFAGIIIIGALWIMRERIKKWANGVR